MFLAFFFYRKGETVQYMINNRGPDFQVPYCKFNKEEQDCAIQIFSLYC